MRASSRLVAGTLLVALALAGCFGSEALPAERTVQASAGRTSDGWAYDGAGLGPAAATLEGTLNNDQNAGSVTVGFAHHGSQYVVTFDQFAESKEFMDGGVAFEIDEHGDSGIGDASIPKIRATLAAWGTATVVKDGEPLVGKAGDRWTAHLMVAEESVRGPDGKITNAAGASPYNPASPADARVIPDDPQALFFIKHPDGETFSRAPLTGSGSLAFAGPESTQSVDVPAEKGASGAILNVTASGGAAPVGFGQIAVRILDAEGNELAGTPQSAFLPNQPPVLSYALDADSVTGPLTVEITGSGSYTATVDWNVTYADYPFIVVTFDEVMVG